MGEIDRLYREQKAQALRLRAENERLRDGWTQSELAVTALTQQLDLERAMTDDAAQVIDLLTQHGQFGDVEAQRWLARYRKARQR